MTYPFRRAAARFIDYLLWGMLVIAVLGEKRETPVRRHGFFMLHSGDMFLLKPF